MSFFKLYIDPSVMSYTIQIVAGAVITIGAIAGIVFRKMKKNVKKTLNIDENKNKEVEEDIVFTDAEEEKTED